MWIDMKTLLVDACNTTLLYKDVAKWITVENLLQNKELLDVVEVILMRKIVVTNANPAIIKESLTWYDYDVFSLENNPNKIDPNFFEQFLEHYELDPKDCNYFDRKQENLNAAKQAGIEWVLFETNVQIIPLLQ